MEKEIIMINFWMKRGWMVIVDIGLGLGLVMWNYARFTIE